MSALASGLVNLHGWAAYLVIAALVFGETAVFVGFVLPGEIATILGGVLASRGHVSLPILILIVVAAAITGPFVGYEIGRRMGDRLFAAKGLARVRGGVERTRSVLGRRGGAAVFLGRFIAVARAIMPAGAGAAGVRLSTFAVYNVVGGLLWGVGYSLLGYLAGSAYVVVERRVGTGVAIAVGVLVVAAAAIWVIRRHQAQPDTALENPPLADAAELDPAEADTAPADSAE
ncbi:MAG TPA: DedA family protein [Streptosporangiaceae bacterium]|nr:DedA family protein [Streptosporangiaceae bacterium]